MESIQHSDTVAGLVELAKADLGEILLEMRPFDEVTIRYTEKGLEIEHQPSLLGVAYESIGVLIGRENG